MKIYLIPLLLVVQIFAAQPAIAINTRCQSIETETDSTGSEPVKKMDALSLTAYVTAVTAIASLFLVPALSLALFPAGMVMGIIGIARGRRKGYKNKKGWGLALAAVVLGGAFTLLFMTAFVVAILSFA